MSDILQFIWAVLGHWQAYVTGGIVIALVTVVERYREKPFSWKVFAWFLTAFLFVAFYLTWHDAYLALRRTISEKSTLEGQLSERDRRIEDLKKNGIVTKRLETTSILNFGKICDGCCTVQKFPLNGAIAGDPIGQGWPPNLPLGVTPSMLVSENNMIRAQVCNGTGRDITYNSVPVRAIIER